ncbi:MAG: LAGLIDADG endonuclease [bacterium]|nr:LAGLIDADG endonuclease [bacterium]
MDNTVGSLTEEQKSILVGCLLGDGTMRKKKNAHLEINHCYAQKVLVDWIFSKYKDLVITKPKWRKGNDNREAYRFTTRSLPIFTPFYDQFFPKGKKIIPNKLKLSPLTLAVWFMDDGCKSRSSIYLNTQQFNLDEQIQLIDILQNQFGIEATLNKDKIYYRIRIRTQSIKIFIKLVEQFVLKEFRYKIPSVVTL